VKQRSGCCWHQVRQQLQLVLHWKRLTVSLLQVLELLQ
jgi:hypothetical protein